MIRSSAHRAVGSLRTVTGVWCCICVHVLIIAVGQACGQACLPFTGSPATGHKCDVFLGGHAYNIFTNTTYAEADAKAAAAVERFKAVLPYKCRQAAVQLACQGLLPVCEFTGTLKVRPPCRSVCEMMWIECLPFMTKNGVSYLLPDCDAVVYSNGTAVPAFPPDGVGSCFPAYVGDAEVPYLPTDCPYPLVFDSTRFRKENPVNACRIECPVLVFGSESKFWGSAVAMYLATGPSMICSLFMALTWILHPQKRRYPAVLMLWLALSAFGFSFSLNLSVLVGGPKRTICTWDEEEVTIDVDNAGDNGGQGVVCILQGIGQYYFSLTSNCWWLAITANLFVMLCFGKNQRIRQYDKYIHYGFHIFCWGIPLIGLIVVLSLKKIGASGINPFCGMVYDENETWVDWVFYTAPIFFCVVCGTILTVISLTRFVVVQLRYEKSRVSELTHLIRIISLVIFVWLNNVFYLAWRLYLADRVFDNIRSQAICSFKTNTDCPYNVGLNYPFYIVALLASSSTGVCIFLAMCTTRSTLVLWVRILSGLRHPRSLLARVQMAVSSRSTSTDSSPPTTMSSSTPFNNGEKESSDHHAL